MKRICAIVGKPLGLGLNSRKKKFDVGVDNTYSTPTIKEEVKELVCIPTLDKFYIERLLREDIIEYKDIDILMLDIENKYITKEYGIKNRIVNKKKKTAKVYRDKYLYGR